MVGQTAAAQNERTRIVKKVGAYTGKMGTAAHQYIKKIERQCQASNLESQMCYVFRNTLENAGIEEWYWDLLDDVRNNWQELKARFLSMQKPVECQMELRERWEQRGQLRHETAQAYANKLKGLVNQKMEERYRPTQHDQLVRFRQGLRPELKSRMQSRPEGYEDLEQTIREARLHDEDIANKPRRSGVLRLINRGTSRTGRALG